MGTPLVDAAKQYIALTGFLRASAGVYRSDIELIVIFKLVCFMHTQILLKIVQDLGAEADCMFGILKTRLRHFDVFGADGG